MRNSSNFTTYSFVDLLPWVYWFHFFMRRVLNDGGTYFICTSSFIISYVLVGNWPQATRMFSRLVQYWLAWPDSFTVADLIFLTSLSCTMWSTNLVGVSNLEKVVGTSFLMVFRYWASGLDSSAELSQWWFHVGYAQSRVFYVQPVVWSLFEWELQVSPWFQLGWVGTPLGWTWVY